MDDTNQRLHDALNAARECQAYVAGTTFPVFLEERMRFRAVERVLEIVGEALGRARQHLPDISDHLPEAHIIVGMRNRIAHGYDQVDEEVIWVTATDDIPRLIERLEALLSDNDLATEGVTP
jgi:uncharacterized protein with HEPN domain